MRSRFFIKNLYHKLESVSNSKHDDDLDDELNQSRLSRSFVDLLAGCLAGGVQVLVAQPFDTVKVKQQTFPKLYKSMIDCFVTTFKNEGIVSGLYAGTLPALWANAGENAALFVAYESCRRFIAALYGLKSVDNLPIFGEACAGGLGSSIATFIVCPSELIKCRLQAMNDLRVLAVAKQKPAPVVLPMGKLIRNIYAAEGLLGFFRGFNATLARDLPGYFCFFGCYEALKEAMREPYQTRAEVGPQTTICAAGIAGIFLYLVSFPADVIKSRIQINNLRSGMLSIGKSIVRKDGYPALYHGLVPSLIQTIPATAVLFLVYEYLKKKLNKFILEKKRRPI